MKRALVVLVTLFVLLYSINEAYATHFMGGEITWECTPQGNFRFTMILYRECYTSNGGYAATFDATTNIKTNVPGFTYINMTRTELKDMSPLCSCPGGPNIFCPGMVNGAANMGGMQENIYTSDAFYPNGVHLTGVPPVTGWYFGHTGCCRNPCSNINGATSSSFFIRAWMYPYNNTPVNTCFDNSPRFEERPATVICSGLPYSYSVAASDPELDSLVYAWDTPLNGGINMQINGYAPGYWFDLPLPGPGHNPNNTGATINPQTGEISFTSYTNGAFITVVKVSAFKSGIKVAEVFRELQVVLLSCGTNIPPGILPPFQNSLGQYTLFADTVITGELVTFTIEAIDPEYCPDTTILTPQTVSLSAYGGQFDTPVNPSGCFIPPCATLNPAPTPVSPLTGTMNVITSFTWQTGCDHLPGKISQAPVEQLYTFLFKASDGFCPAPGVNNAMVTIVVKDLPAILPPDFLIIDVFSNGDALLNWTPAKDTMNSFKGYYIYFTPGQSGQYFLADSLLNISDTSYYYTCQSAPVDKICFYVSVRSGCRGSIELNTDTVCGTTINIPGKIENPHVFHVEQNLPNPTSGSTTIPFTMPEAGTVILKISDIAGQTVVTSLHHAKSGENTIVTDVSWFSAGIYFYSLNYQSYLITRKMVVSPQ